MTPGEIVAIVIAGVIGLFLTALVIRTALNKPKHAPVALAPPAQIDKDKAVEHLIEAVRIPTVSMVEDYVDNREPFIEFRNWLERAYPLLNEKAERTIVADYSIVYHLKGANPSLKAGCYLSHIDVVPAPADGWEHDPFSGHLSEDGYVYGRGSQDMKGHMIALLEAVEYHLSNGKMFERDLYLCFGHDEEPGTSTEGASNIVKHLKESGAQVEFVVDEGGTVLDGRMLGIPHTVALIGAAEKGNGDLEIVVNKSGGHASNPNPPTADGVLANAICKIEKNPMKTRWTALTKETFKELSPYCGGSALGRIFKFALTNRDVLSLLVKFIFTVAAPMTNALVRTTFAPTMLWGSDARNVIPKDAKANINYRMITGEKAEDVKAYLEKLLKKDVKKGHLKVELLNYSNPSPEADVHCDAYENIRKSILETFDDVVVAPYMFIAATDARFYNPLTDNVFRFGPFINSLDDQARIHGINERLHVDGLEKAVQFFVRCLENTLG